jgi:hypothetical protein
LGIYHSNIMHPNLMVVSSLRTKCDILQTYRVQKRRRKGESR